ncbi:MAG: ATP-binding cassette domain-containing protein, partial [Methanopyri archaeon]|nr:ATP-binding cassette domain-containing protein [Methanopyri archaeon]
MDAVVVKDVVKSYGDRHALDGVSISVKEGETLCIVGPNGAGKSTLLESLAGLVAPT